MQRPDIPDEVSALPCAVYLAVCQPCGLLACGIRSETRCFASIVLAKHEVGREIHYREVFWAVCVHRPTDI